MNMNTPPISKAVAYPKDDKYFNQLAACLEEVGLLLGDFPRSAPRTCPFPAELWESC